MDEKKLYDEINAEFEDLSKMALGTEEYKVTVDGLTKLMDRAIDMKKFDTEYAERIENQKMDNSLKQRQMNEERKDRLIKNGISIAGIVIPSLITIWGTVKSMEFEKEGTITTITWSLSFTFNTRFLCDITMKTN